MVYKQSYDIALHSKLADNPVAVDCFISDSGRYLRQVDNDYAENGGTEWDRRPTGSE